MGLLSISAVNTLFTMATAMNGHPCTFIYLFMISSPFPLLDIFGMQTSWATHVINIMALNNCDQNSCGVGLHNRQHFLYLMHPVMTTKILKINISVHDSTLDI